MAAMTGARVALAEEYRMGGTCVIRGCIPKKLLVYASQFSENFLDAPGYGWTIGDAKFDWPTLIANKDREIARLEGLYTHNVKAAGVDHHSPTAPCSRTRTRCGWSIENRTVTAEKILIATGNRPTREMGTSHVIPGGELCITSNEAFHLEELPKRILIAGGGYIALEFAHIFHGLGSHVSLVYRGDKPLRGFDDDMRDALCDSMQARGLEVLLGCEFTKVEKRGDCLHAETNKGATIECDQIMLAIGRQPNTDMLHVEKAGVELGKKGEVKVDEYSRTSAPHIWAVGDVTDRVQLTPVAIHEAMCFVETAFKNNPTAPDHVHVPSAVFTTPELAAVGLSEEKALADGPQHRRLQIHLPAAAAHAGRARRAHPDEAGGGCQDRQSAGLPHLRRPCRRDHPGRRRGAAHGRDQGGFRQHHRAASHRRRGTGDDADARAIPRRRLDYGDVMRRCLGFA